MPKFTEGQMLLLVPQRRHAPPEPYWAKIEVVGRKWLTVRAVGHRYVERVSIETMQTEESFRPTRAYLSEEHYRQSVEADRLWKGLQKWMQYRNRPVDLMPDAINAAIKALGAEDDLRKDE